MNCSICDNIDIEPSTDEGTICQQCVDRYPAALLKAVGDPFDYALRLRTGELFYFSEAAVNGGEFVHLELHSMHDDKAGEKPLCPFARGVDVRASDIVWCADAPWGS